MGLPIMASPDVASPQAHNAGVAAKATTRRQVSDSQITADVKKLLSERIPARYKMDVKTTRGVVLLNGDLADRNMVDRVRGMVVAVDGVKGVNMLGVDYPFIVTTF